MPITLRGPDGQTIDADEGKIQFWVNQGYRPIGEEEVGQEIAQRAQAPEDRGALGGINALLTRTLSGMTLGGSDVLLSQMGTEGQHRRLQADIEQHPIASGAGQIAGEVLPALATGGESLELAEAMPSARLSRFATQAGEFVPGTGAAARVGRLAVTGAVEGSVSNAGQYLGQMALADKPVSAEGFLASMRDGALYGGGTAGALGISGEGLVAARRLLPETELTPLAAKRARAVATQEVSHAVDDSGELVEVARAKARRIREEAVAMNPELKAELDKIALQKAKDLADAQVGTARARQGAAESNASAAQARAEAAAARAERAKNPKTRKAMQAPEAAPVESEIPSGLRSSIPEVPETPDDMMRKLMDNKNALDQGASLADLSARRKETYVEDALNARVAQDNPEMDRLLRHLDGLTDARERVGSWLDKYGPESKVKNVEYVEGMRKRSGFAEVVPQGEGTVGLPRGRQFELRGGEGDRLAFEGKVARGDLHRIVDDPLTTAEDRLAAQRALGLSGEEQAQALAELQAKRTAKEIVGAGEHAPDVGVDQHVERALNGHADLADDVDDATEAISTLEQKTADLSDELGPEAPPMAQSRAQGYRQAQAGVDESHAKATEDAISDADRAAKTISLGGSPAKRAGGIMGKVKTAAEVLEALQMLGVPVPGVRSIPVVGPLLSMYLKAKLAMRAVGKLGGKVPRTAETEIARRAAETKTKLIRAADRALAGTARVATSPRAAIAVSVLATTLFDDRDPATPEKKTKPKDTMQELYLARRDELQRAMVPGAVREAVRRRVRTGDATMIDAIASAEENKLKYLHDTMPQVDEGLPVFGKRPVRAPARADMEQWARRVEACQRPVETMEAILDGQLVSAESSEALRTCYPQLVAQIQQHLIEKAVESDKPMAYKRKVQLSISLGLPLDDSQTPESAAMMGMLYQPKPAPQPGMAPQANIVSQHAQRVDPEART